MKVTRLSSPFVVPSVLSVLALGVVAALAPACGSSVDCATVKPYAEITAFTNSCNACHSSSLSGVDRQEAPSDINYDTYAAAIEDTGETAEVIDEGEMPPPEGTALTDEERQDLLTWLSCGTPE